MSASINVAELPEARFGDWVYLPDPSFRRWFELLSVTGLCRLFHAVLPTGEIVASQLVLTGLHPVSHTVSAAIDPGRRSMGAAAFLRWKAFEALGAAGNTHNDLTDASLNPVTHFKSQLGGELVVNLLVDSPGTARWRIGGQLEAGVESFRSRAGNLLRSVLSRGNR